MHTARKQLEAHLEEGNCYILRDDQGALAAAFTLTADDVERCDVKASLTRLLNYYESMGFYEKRRITYPTTQVEAVLLEVEAGKILED